MSALKELVAKETQEAGVMSSIEFRDIINKERVKAGESKVENSHFLKRIEDELDDLGGTKTFRPAQGGTPMSYYDLNFEQCLLVGMRESKAVRRNVLAKLKELQAPVKQITYQEALRQLANEIDAKEQALLERNIAIRTKAYIGSKREATAMNTARQANKRTALAIEQISVVSEQRDAALIELDQSKQWSTIKRMEIATGNKFNWRTLKAVGSSLGVSAKDVYDPIYNTVKSYHAVVWEEAYGLDISKL